MDRSIDYEKKLADQISNAANGRLSDREAYASFVAFASCAGHGMNSVGDKPTTGSYRQV